MADAFLLKIDLPLLMDHFADSGEALSFEAAKTWLRKLGFHRTDEGWIAEEHSIMALDRSEYPVMRRM